MALNDAALSVAANAIETAITHMQLHSGAPGVNGTANVTTAARRPVDGTVDADGDITWSNIPFTGVASNGACTFVSYWNSLTGGTHYGSSALSGDTTANILGEYTVTSVTENGTAV